MGDRHICYLPLAHIYERINLVMVGEGVRVQGAPSVSFYQQPISLTYPRGRAAYPLICLGVTPLFDYFACQRLAPSVRSLTPSLRRLSPPHAPPPQAHSARTSAAPSGFTAAMYRWEMKAFPRAALPFQNV